MSLTRDEIRALEIAAEFAQPGMWDSVEDQCMLARQIAAAERHTPEARSADAARKRRERHKLPPKEPRLRYSRKIATCQRCGVHFVPSRGSKGLFCSQTCFRRKPIGRMHGRLIYAEP